MKFDNIIIGGGLSGLISAVESARAGKNTAVVSTGQSALHFWSGSFEVLSSHDGKEVMDSPLSLAPHLSLRHPYRIFGEEKTRNLLNKVPGILADAGIHVRGSLERNHLRMTPLGFVKPAWLTLDEYFSFDSPEQVAGKKFAIINIYSYNDFYPSFLAAGLEKLGASSFQRAVNIPQLNELRRSTTEMRATNMSRFLRDDADDLLASEINKASEGADAVIMPAVLGIFSDAPVKRLLEGVDRPVYFIATTPASVPGVRCQFALRDYFIRLGGTFFQGDTVVRGEFDNNRLARIFTANFEDMPLEADNFVLATGSFFGHGLIATINKIFEPAFGFDLNAPNNREEWYRKNVYDSQPYMGYGVITDDMLHPSKNGTTIENVYAAGAILSGFNALKEGSGAGITLATALNAAEMISK